MNAKHQFKYTYTDTNIEEISPVEITFDMPGEVTITQMLYNFESYLKAVGFIFDGHLEVVPDRGYDLEDEGEEEPPYGCMADFDKENGLEDTSSSLDNEWTKAEKAIKEWNEGIAKLDNEQKMKAFKEACSMSDTHNEAIKKEVKKNKCNDYSCNNVGVKTDKDMWNKIAENVKQKWVHGMCNPPSPDRDKNNPDNCWNS